MEFDAEEKAADHITPRLVSVSDAYLQDRHVYCHIQDPCSSWCDWDIDGPA
jgi:hypothetical protein